MSTEDARRWDARYEGQPLAEPNPPDALVDAGMADQLAGLGRALDIACGSGGQSVWLAQRGFDVTAIDGSPVAVEMTAAAAAAAGVDVDTSVVDLDNGLPDHLGDFDVIVCQRFRGVELYGPLVDRLRLRGIAVVTVLSQTGASSPGPFHAPPGELLAAFDRPEAATVYHHEGDGQESIIVRRN